MYHQGSAWQALRYSQGTKPGDPNGAFEQLLTAQDGSAICTATRVFTAGDIVVYLPSGKKYVAQWYTRNQTPGQAYGPWKLTG